MHFLFKENRRACIFAGLFVLAGIFSVALFAPSSHLHDERVYLPAVRLIGQYGISVDYFSHYPSAGAGPLYAVCHHLLKPLTHLEMPGMRMLNPALLLATFILLAQLLVFCGELPDRARLSALAIVGTPFAVFMNSLALTEMPAIFFLMLSLVLLFWVIKSEMLFLPQTLISAAGGMALGLAIIGRQPYLVFFASLALLWLVYPQKRLMIFIFSLAASILPAILFTAWGGLTPSYLHIYPPGFAFRYPFLAFCHAGLMVLLIAPRWFKANGIICLGAFLANLVTGFIQFPTSVYILEKVIGAKWMWVYTRLGSSLLVAVGAIFVWTLIGRMIENRKDPAYLFFALAVILVLLTNVKITHQYSARYAGMVLVFIPLIVRGYERFDFLKAMSIFFGGMLGFFSLLPYLLKIH